MSYDNKIYDPTESLDQLISQENFSEIRWIGILQIIIYYTKEESELYVTNIIRI